MRLAGYWGLSHEVKPQVRDNQQVEETALLFAEGSMPYICKQHSQTTNSLGEKRAKTEKGDFP